MARRIWHDTDKLIEEDDAGNVTTAWTNPRADGARLAAVDTDEPHTLSSLAGRVARIEEHLWPAPPDPATVDDAPEWSGIWPAGGLLRDGGKV